MVRVFRYKAYPTPAQVRTLRLMQRSYDQLWNMLVNAHHFWALERGMQVNGGVLQDWTYAFRLGTKDAVNCVDDLKKKKGQTRRRATAKAPPAYNHPNEHGVWHACHRSFDQARQAMWEMRKKNKGQLQDAPNRLQFEPRHRDGSTPVSLSNVLPYTWSIDPSDKGNSKTAYLNTHGRVGRLRIRYYRDLLGDIADWRIKETRRGEWWVYVTCKNVPQALTASPSPDLVGLDWGVTTFITESTGRTHQLEHLSTPKQKRAAERLADVDRQLSRLRELAKKKRTPFASRKYRRLRDIKARLSSQLMRAREHDHYVVANDLCRRYGIIGVEKLDVKEMTDSSKRQGKTRKRKAKSTKNLLHTAPSMFQQRLKSVAAREGCQVVEVLAKGTTRTCNACGHEGQKLDTSVRQFECEACGYTEERDLHAALNVRDRTLSILAEGEASPFAIVRRQKTRQTLKRKKVPSDAVAFVLENGSQEIVNV